MLHAGDGAIPDDEYIPDNLNMDGDDMDGIDDGNTNMNPIPQTQTANPVTHHTTGATRTYWHTPLGEYAKKLKKFGMKELMVLAVHKDDLLNGKNWIFGRQMFFDVKMLGLSNRR